MPDVAKHAWTHRPRSQGGTDPVVISTLLPYGYSVVSEFTMVSGDAYSLGVLDGQFVGSIEGVSQGITTGNYPSGADRGVFFDEGGVERGMMCDDGPGSSCMVEFDAALYLPDSFTGTASMWLDQQSTTWPSWYRTPTQNVYQSQLIDPQGNMTLRLSGQAVWGGSNTNPGSATVSDLIHVVVSQDSGGDVDVGQGWFTLTRLSPLNDEDEFLPA